MSAAQLLDLHTTLAWVVVGLNAAAGSWALAAHWLEVLRGRPLWAFTLVAQASIFLQVILGVYLMSAEEIEPSEFHTFYGFVMLLTVGLVYSYRPQVRPHQFLLYGGGGLFLMGLALRAIFLA